MFHNCHLGFGVGIKLGLRKSIKNVCDHRVLTVNSFHLSVAPVLKGTVFKMCLDLSVQLLREKKCSLVFLTTERFFYTFI